MLVLQVSHVRYSKPTKNPKVLIPFMACIVLMFVPRLAICSAAVMFAYGIWFAFVSPFFFRRFLAGVAALRARLLGARARGRGPRGG